MDILVFGSISMDLTTYVSNLPRLGETLRGSSYITVPGGKGDNQAVAAAGAIATTRKGALPAMPYRDEVIALLEK